MLAPGKRGFFRPTRGNASLLEDVRSLWASLWASLHLTNTTGHDCDPLLVFRSISKVRGGFPLAPQAPHTFWKLAQLSVGLILPLFPGASSIAGLLCTLSHTKTYKVPGSPGTSELNCVLTRVAAMCVLTVECPQQGMNRNQVKFNLQRSNRLSTSGVSTHTVTTVLERKLQHRRGLWCQWKGLRMVADPGGRSACARANELHAGKHSGGEEGCNGMGRRCGSILGGGWSW